MDASGISGLMVASITDPQGWPPLLDALASMHGATSAGMLTSGPAGSHFHGCARATSPDLQHSYVEEYGGIDPVPGLVAKLAVAECAILSDHLTRAEREADRFFAEWCIPNEMGEAIFARLACSAHGDDWLCFAYPIATGRRDIDRYRRRLQPLLLSLGKALEMARRFDALEAVGDATGQAIIGFDRSGRVVHANGAACALALDDHGIAIARGSLVVREPAVAGQVAKALDRLLDPNGEEALVPLAVTGRKGSVTCLDLMRAPPDSPFAVTAIAATDPQLAETDIRRLAGRYGLTPAETRVTFHVARGEGLGETAIRLGISRATARVHAQRVFDKCDVHSQAGLADLAHRMRRLTRLPEYRGDKPFA